MENTGKLFFQDDSPQWYIAIAGQPVGPLTATDVYQRVLNGEISWADFVWKPGQSGWERICEIKVFKAAVPPVPGREVLKEAREAAKPAAKSVTPPTRKPSARKAEEEAAPEPVRNWFLYFNDSQHGPVSDAELEHALGIGKINARVHAWKEGMSDWERIEKLPEFRDAVARLKTAPVKRAGPPPRPDRKEPARIENRSSPRRPLVARILMASQKAGGGAVGVAMCRDISVGGLQILTDQIPGEVGARVKMNVSATGAGSKIEPFVAEGVIVRLLEDGRGFSFRFEKLSDAARRSIESYIANA